jgi:hypothetical protein
VPCRRENVVKEGTKSGRLRHRRRVRAALPLTLRALLCRVPAGHRRHGGRGGRPVRRGTALPRAVLDGRVRAGAEQRGDCGGVAAFGGPVQRREPAGNGGIWRRHWPASTRPRADPTRPSGNPTCRQAGIPPAGKRESHLPEPTLVWMCSGAPAWRSALTAGRWPKITAHSSAV